MSASKVTVDCETIHGSYGEGKRTECAWRLDDLLDVLEADPTALERLRAMLNPGPSE